MITPGVPQGQEPGWHSKWETSLNYRRLIAAFFCLLAVSTASLVAFSPPEGPVLLTVTGHADVPGPVAFDRALLEELPAVTFTTTTIWTDGPQEFTGVPLSALMAHLGIRSGTLRAVAANDYAVEIPLESLGEDAPILAYRQNGEEMSLRDRGPLWVVYPYDRAAEYRTEVIYSRSIWQLRRIELQD